MGGLDSWGMLWYLRLVGGCSFLGLYVSFGCGLGWLRVLSSDLVVLVGFYGVPVWVWWLC